MANNQTLPFVPATSANMIANPAEQLQREVQERQKNLLAAGKTPASSANMITPFGGAVSAQGLIGG